MTFDEAAKLYDIHKGLPKNDNPMVILTDCMDTIITRDFSLERLLQIWAKRVAKEFGIRERFLLNYRREVLGGKMHNTVPISVIYQEIANHCVFFGIIESSQQEIFCKRCHQIEMEIELSSQHLINATADYLKKAKAKGSRIYCVSDFRLPGSDITEFYKNQDVSELFDGVFSSCDFGATKKKGDLYSKIIDKIGCTPDCCVMIGDNLKSDCINAAKAGIKGYHLI